MLFSTGGYFVTLISLRQYTYRKIHCRNLEMRKRGQNGTANGRLVLNRRERSNLTDLRLAFGSLRMSAYFRADSIT